MSVYEGDANGLSGIFAAIEPEHRVVLTANSVVSVFAKLLKRHPYSGLPADVVAEARRYLRSKEEASIAKATEESKSLAVAFAKSDAELRERVRAEGLFFPAAGLVRSDGNCLPDSVAVYLGTRTGGSSNADRASQKTRLDIVSWLEDNENALFSNGLRVSEAAGNNLKQFCTRMKKPGAWMESPCVNAIAEMLGTNVVLIHSGRMIDKKLVFKPRKRKNRPPLYLAWWEELHYSVLFPEPYGIL